LQPGHISGINLKEKEGGKDAPEKIKVDDADSNKYELLGRPLNTLQRVVVKFDDD